MFKRSYLYPVTVLISLICPLMLATQEHLIVFDCTDTLITVQEELIRSQKVANIPGINSSGLWYAVTNLCFNPVEAAERDFRALLQSFGTQTGPQHEMIRDQKGQILSLIITEWLAGRLSSQELQRRINSRAKYKLFKQIASVVFNSTTVAHYTTLIPAAIPCVTRAISAVGAGHVFMIGNWERIAFYQAAQQSTLSPLFSLIPPAQRIISGDIQQLMPRNARTFFDRVIGTSGLSYDAIIFISSMPYHIQAAQRLGIRTIFVSHHNFDAAWQQLTQLLATP